MRYRARIGITYNGVRHEAGEDVDDVPEQSVGWLLARGHIEPVQEDKGESGKRAARKAGQDA